MASSYRFVKEYANEKLSRATGRDKTIWNNEERRRTIQQVVDYFDRRLITVDEAMRCIANA